MPNDDPIAPVPDSRKPEEGQNQTQQYIRKPKVVIDIILNDVYENFWKEFFSFKKERGKPPVNPSEQEALQLLEKLMYAAITIMIGSDSVIEGRLQLLDLIDKCRKLLQQVKTNAQSLTTNKYNEFLNNFTREVKAIVANLNIKEDDINAINTLFQNHFQNHINNQINNLQNEMSRLEWRITDLVDKAEVLSLSNRKDNKKSKEAELMKKTKDATINALSPLRTMLRSITMKSDEIDKLKLIMSLKQCTEMLPEIMSPLTIGKENKSEAIQGDNPRTKMQNLTSYLIHELGITTTEELAIQSAAREEKSKATDLAKETLKNSFLRAIRNAINISPQLNTDTVGLFIDRIENRWDVISKLINAQSLYWEQPENVFSFLELISQTDIITYAKTIKADLIREKKLKYPKTTYQMTGATDDFNSQHGLVTGASAPTIVVSNCIKDLFSDPLLANLKKEMRDLVAGYHFHRKIFEILGSHTLDERQDLFNILQADMTDKNAAEEKQQLWEQFKNDGLEQFNLLIISNEDIAPQAISGFRQAIANNKSIFGRIAMMMAASTESKESAVTESTIVIPSTVVEAKSAPIEASQTAPQAVQPTQQEAASLVTQPIEPIAPVAESLAAIPEIAVEIPVATIEAVPPVDEDNKPLDSSSQDTNIQQLERKIEDDIEQFKRLLISGRNFSSDQINDLVIKHREYLLKNPKKSKDQEKAEQQKANEIEEQKQEKYQPVRDRVKKLEEAGQVFTSSQHDAFKALGMFELMGLMSSGALMPGKSNNDQESREEKQQKEKMKEQSRQLETTIHKQINEMFEEVLKNKNINITNFRSRIKKFALSFDKQADDETSKRRQVIEKNPQTVTNQDHQKPNISKKAEIEQRKYAQQQKAILFMNFQLSFLNLFEPLMTNPNYAAKLFNSLNKLSPKLIEIVDLNFGMGTYWENPVNMARLFHLMSIPNPQEYIKAQVIAIFNEQQSIWKQYPKFNPPPDYSAIEIQYLRQYGISSTEFSSKPMRITVGNFATRLFQGKNATMRKSLHETTTAYFIYTGLLDLATKDLTGKDQKAMLSELREKLRSSGDEELWRRFFVGRHLLNGISMHLANNEPAKIPREAFFRALTQALEKETHPIFSDLKDKIYQVNQEYKKARDALNPAQETKISKPQSSGGYRLQFYSPKAAATPQATPEQKSSTEELETPKAKK